MYKILLVDDESKFASELLSKLEDEFKVCLITDPFELLEPEESLDLSGYDLIVSDLRMPAMDGVTFLIRLRETYSSLPPQVMVTSFVTEASRIDAYENKITDFIEKSLSGREICSRLKNAIHRGLEAKKVSQGNLG